MNSAYQDLKEEAYVRNMEIPKRGLAIYTFGNVSVFDRQRSAVAIKSSGIPYEGMTVEDMVVLDLDGNIIEGARRPSSDTRTHLVLYRNFDGIGGIVHTHSTYAVAFAQAGIPIPIYGTTHADHVAGDIPVTNMMSDSQISGNYEEETGNLILAAFDKRSHLECEMVLVASHGPFSWGKDAEKAVYNSAVLEELARMAYLTQTLNPQTPRLKDSLIRKHYERKHGKNAYYGQIAKDQ